MEPEDQLDANEAAPGAPPIRPQAGPPYCSGCGYSLRGLGVDTNCPECGTPILYSVSGDSRTNGYAVASFVLGICGIVLGCSSYGLIGLICGPLALVYHSKAVAKVASGQAPPSTLGLAKAGKICGWIALAIAIFFIVMITLLIVLGVAIPLLTAPAGGAGGGGSGRDVDPMDHAEPIAPTTAPPVLTHAVPCRTCGHPLTGLPYGTKCPECDTPIADSIRTHHAESADSSLCLLFGALALVAPILSLILAPAAIIFYIRAKDAFKRGETSRAAHALALTGLIMASIALIASIPLAILLLILIF